MREDQKLPTAAVQQLRTLLSPSRVAVDLPIRLAYARDASAYRLIPQAVVFPKSVEEIQQLFRFAERWKVPVTIRGSGTSLSGQAVTSGVIVDIRRYWQHVAIENNGTRVRVQPGALGGRVNQQLKVYQRRIGPDPASLNFCTIGGILANNASGIRCNVHQNAYHTLHSLTLILPSGVVLNTAMPEAQQVLRQHQPQLVEGLLDIRRRLLEHPVLQKRIAAKYSQKNTTGYGMNAFLDFSDPVRILQQLMIGSEGTLGFIAEAVLSTLPLKPFALTALVVFESITDAATAVAQVPDAEAVELMDSGSLRSIASVLQQLGFTVPNSSDIAALLIEFRWEQRDHYTRSVDHLRCRLNRLAGKQWMKIADNEIQQALMWNARKGLYPAVGAQRPCGTTVLIEDIVVPVKHLAAATVAIRRLCQRYGYENVVIFGHAKAGNLHFVITPQLDTEAGRRRYRRFMEELVAIVIHRFDGALKGEHGTGRNMAPFVVQEWGEEITQWMKEIKSLCDPSAILNPDVVLSDNSQVHCQNLKLMPAVDVRIDQCTECGFCESVCPSRWATVTPRQRIQLLREWLSLPETVQHRWRRQFAILVEQSCAADHQCALSCPLGVDTGAFVIELRRRQKARWQQQIAQWAARNFALVQRGFRIMLRLGWYASILPGLRAVMPAAVQQWFQVFRPSMYRIAFRQDREETPSVLFLPSCFSQLVHRQGSSKALPVHILTVLAQGGMSATVPPQWNGCCGLVFDSLGLPNAGKILRERSMHQIRQQYLSDRAHYGILQLCVDQSSCTRHWKKHFDELFCDLTELLCRLPLPRSLADTAIHLSCGVLDSPSIHWIRSVLSQWQPAVIIEQCCGMAGGRGVFVPAVSTTALEGVEIPETVKRIYTTNLSCAPALHRSFHRPVAHIAELWE